ncbi:MAG: shikimate dehydrogenase [Prevotella sp.]|nr:shikimate dehydrogenase [Prevotella sp.]MBR3513793.1 shikimate dehydrogenase [Bacteroidaceae bacterium]
MKQYGLLGYPLGHSFSRAFFTDKFQREGIDAEYLNFELPDISRLPEVLDTHPQLRGLNVTIPHKQAVIPYLDALSDEARAIGAVNTIRITHDADGHRLLKGFNSDIIGFTDSIRPLLKPHHTRALVLGTGGASKAICRGLEQLGLEWCYVSRSPREGLLTYSDITPARIADYTVIVNCSPVGMHPHTDESPALPYAALSPRHLLFDLVYNPETTLFMRQGRRFGATVKNGLEMLHLQALASWRFWETED